MLKINKKEQDKDNQIKGVKNYFLPQIGRTRVIGDHMRME